MATELDLAQRPERIESLLQSLVEQRTIKDWYTTTEVARIVGKCPPTQRNDMLLTITTTHEPASDLSYLLHKRPDRCQNFDLSFGKAHVFYPEAGDKRCSVCLLLDVDPVGLVRGKNANSSFELGQYVNDRPYSASSFLSVAIAQVFGSALQGRSKDRPQLVETPLPLAARIDVLPVRGGEGFLHRMFEPLGYQIEATRCPLDERFPEWGDSPYYAVTLHKTTTLKELLTHLYVLIPVFDNRKHYWIGDDELEKLLKHGDGWLADHPEKDEIARRYLKFQPSLFRQALARLVQEEEPEVAENDEAPRDSMEESLESPLSLSDQRIGAVLAALRAFGAKRVLDLGCGEGKLIRELLKDKEFEEIVGLDVSIRSLEIAQKRLAGRASDGVLRRLKLIHGSLMYRDKRLEGFDAASVIEVIEHLDPPRLSAFERVLFEFARPRTIVLTTPNREYNSKWETLPAGKMRHPDHRFEWTRQEFQDWASRVSLRFGYTVRFVAVGAEDANVGPPTQMGVFQRG
jgi:3' terminal RNA ribose 2'-O-methyltransferase Hen1